MFDKLLAPKPADGRVAHLTKTLITRFDEHNISRIGGQLAYFIMLSIFPFLIFLNALVGSFNIPQNAVIEFLQPFFPQRIVDMISGYVAHLAGNGNMRLVSIGVVVTIFSASKSVRSLGYAFNTAYGIKERESHVHSMVFSFLFIIAAGIVVVLVVMFVALSKTFLTRIVELHNVPNAIMNMLGIWRWVTLAVILFFILAVMYKSVPDKKLRIRDIVPGTLLSMLGFFGLTVGFSIYVNHFMSNSAMYGTMGTVVLLMLWIYIASMILVLGAELNSALEIMPHKIKKRQGEEAHKEQ